MSHRRFAFAAFVGRAACADSDPELTSFVTVRDSAGGEVVRELTLPADFRPGWTDGEVVAGRVNDERDVEYLHFYRVPGGEADDV